MKIGSKISLFYTWVTICAIVLIVSVFYLFTLRYINKIYDSYLIDKAYLTAQKYWEKDEVDEQSYLLIQRKYNELLPQANEVLLNADNMSVENKDSLNKYLDTDLQKKLYSGLPVFFSYKNKRGAALYYPDNEGNFIVLVMAHNDYGSEIRKHILPLMLCLLVISFVLIYFIGRIYSNRILAPLQHILKEIKKIRGKNLNVRLKLSGNKDELDDLIYTLNKMLDRLDEAFKAEKSFVSNASHELNNPLTAIQGECEITLMKERSIKEYIESFQRISTESNRMTQLIRQLLFLSHQDDELLNTVESVNVPEFFKQLCEENKRLRFSDLCKNSQSVILNVNPYLFKVAIGNILNNACKYSDDFVDIRLDTSDGNITIEIQDYGIGIPEGEIESIFQSFYRASNARGYTGHGIGLSLSLKILSVYGGKISIDSKKDAYTKVFIIFS